MTSAAARMKAWRERHSKGRAIVPVEIDIKPVTEYLVDAELLQLAQVEHRAAIGGAIQKLLDLLLVTEHSRRDA